MLSTDPPQATCSQLDLRLVGNFVSQMGSRACSIGSDLINIGRSLQRAGSEIASSQQLTSVSSASSSDPF